MKIRFLLSLDEIQSVRFSFFSSDVVWLLLLRSSCSVKDRSSSCFHSAHCCTLIGVQFCLFCFSKTRFDLRIFTLVTKSQNSEGRDKKTMDFFQSMTSMITNFIR